MTTATLKAQGKLITDIFEGYTRYAMTDDGRVFRCGTVGRIRSYVWIDDEHHCYYKDLFSAYFDQYAKRL